LNYLRYRIALRTRYTESRRGEWYEKYKRLKQGVDNNVQCVQTNRRRDDAVFVAFLQILHLTSATLQTLHMDFQRWKIFPAPLDVGISAWKIPSMPVLRELTVQYYALLFHAEMDVSLFLDDQGGGWGGDGAVTGIEVSRFSRARICLIYTSGY
jgi:hypothetical protein